MDGTILRPQKHERHTGPAPLRVDHRPVGLWPFLRLACLWRWKKPLCLVGQVIGQRSAEAGMLGTLQILSCRCTADAQVYRDLPLRQPRSLQPQSISDLAHR